MSLGIWIALVILAIYLALVHVAKGNGWLERHNMTLVAGCILMWRTKRGRGFIERLSGRGSPAEVLSAGLEELRKERLGVQEELDRATEALSTARDVGRFWELEAKMGPLRERRGRASQLGRRLDELRQGGEVKGPAPELARLEGQLKEAVPEGMDALEEAYNSLKGQMYTIEVSIPPDSRFADMLMKRTDEAVVETLGELEADASRRVEEYGARVQVLDKRISETEAHLGRTARSEDAAKEARKADRRLRFWKGYGSMAIALIVFFMFAMLALLVWQAFVVVRIPPGVIKPQQMLGLPGINPVIPLWYGIAGLVVAMVVHELAHGILTRVGKVPVKSLGLLLLVVPIGAFVEPDEEQLGKVDRARRSRVFAVGPVTNIIVAFLAAGLFAWVFMASVQPAVDGVVLNHIVDRQEVPAGNNTSAMMETPASKAGLEPWSIITRIEALDGPPLGALGQNASDVRSADDFLATMDRTQAGQRVSITWWHDGHTRNSTVTLWDKGLVYQGMGFDGKGYLGASSRLINEVPAGEYPKALAHPLRYSDSALGFRNVTFFYISLPFTSPSLAPAPGGVTQAFKVTGPLSRLGTTGFWVLSNFLYWVFWLNIMVGIFNSLPAVPLDGGYIFRDGLSGLISRVSPKGGIDRADGLALRVTGALSMLILLLIVWQFVGPYFGSALGLG